MQFSNSFDSTFHFYSYFTYVLKSKRNKMCQQELLKLMLCLWVCCIESMVLTSNSALHLLYDSYHLSANVKSNTFIRTLIDKYIYFLSFCVHVCVALAWQALSLDHHLAFGVAC